MIVVMAWLVRRLLCAGCLYCFFFFFFQAEDGIRDIGVTGAQTCALPISLLHSRKKGQPTLDDPVPPVHARQRGPGRGRALFIGAELSILASSACNTLLEVQFQLGLVRQDARSRLIANSAATRDQGTSAGSSSNACWKKRSSARRLQSSSPR